MITVPANASIEKHMRVTRSGAVAGVTDLDIGIARVRAEAGGTVGVHTINAVGTVRMLAATSFSEGDEVYTAANGAVSSVKASGSILRGIAMEDAEAGNVFEVLNMAYPVDVTSGVESDGGYEFTAGFADRTTGTGGASDVGSNVSYTQDMVDNDRWLRFGFDSTQQATNDFAYWTEPTPAPTAGVGLFGGSYMPSGVTSMFDFDFNASTYSDAVETGDLQYTAADGSFDFSQCVAGDLALVRFDFNVLPQIANTTLEVAMIWQTRLSDGTPTFTFALTGDPMFYGTGTVGRTFLARPLLSAYFASQEDVNARALLAIRADNPIQIQPLTTLTTIQR